MSADIREDDVIFSDDLERVLKLAEMALNDPEAAKDMSLAVKTENGKSEIVIVKNGDIVSI